MLFLFKKKYIIYISAIFMALLLLIMSCLYYYLNKNILDNTVAHKILTTFIVFYLIILVIVILTVLISMKLYTKNYTRKKEADSLDPITQLYDKSAFETRIISAISFYKYYNVISSLIFLEINDFKTITNELSQDKVNQLLKEIADNFNDTRRTSDVLFRWNKSEFVVIAKCNITNAFKAAKRYQENIKDIQWKKDTPVTISVRLSQILKSDTRSDIYERIKRVK